MSGDSFGSPRRDDRHNSIPEGPEDRKVAGPSFHGRPADFGDARSGDTAGLPPLGPAPLVVETPSAPRRSGRAGLKIAAVAAGVVVVVGGGAVGALALTGEPDAKAAAPKQPSTQALADAPVQVDPMLEQQMRRKAAYERASRESRGTGAVTRKAPKLLPKGEPIPTKKPKSKDEGGNDDTGSAGPDPMPAGQAQQVAKSMLASSGMGGSGQFACLVKLWNKESGWRVKAANPTSGAYGIPQALPGSKMASAGADWRTNARTQIKWGLGYIKNRYKTPCGAWGHSQRVGWY